MFDPGNFAHYNQLPSQRREWIILAECYLEVNWFPGPEMAEIEKVVTFLGPTPLFSEVRRNGRYCKRSSSPQ